MQRTLFSHILLFILSASTARAADVDNSLSPVYLNHLYIVVDPETYADIGNSDFLQNEFASFTKRTVNAGGGDSWSGTYLRGERTYLEFFEPSEKKSATNNLTFTLHQSGIAFGPEVEGSIDLIHERFRKLFGDKAKKQLRIAKLDQKEVPWFHYVEVDYDTNVSIFSS